jgi:hypothetical protein
MGKLYPRVGIAVALVAAALFGLASQAQAGSPASPTTDTLQHLVDVGGSLTIGDKIFSDFTFQTSGLTNFDPSQIQVTASVAGGIYFLTWAGNISLVNNGASAVTADLLLKYTVTATAGQISMIDQMYSGRATQPGSFIAVDETVRVGDIILANSHLNATDLADPFAEAGDHLNVNPAQTTLHVTKDISFGSLSQGSITITEVSQSFHQIPEAATTALLGFGMAFVGAVAYRQKRKA